MGMTPEEWLASNTKYCQPLHMRLTPTACQALRTRKWTSKFGEEYAGGTPSACTGCPGLQDALLTSNPWKGIQVTYTVKNIADLVGTTKRIVHNARSKFKAGKKSQGGAAGNVQAWLDANEIRWEDVVNEPKILWGRKP